MTSTRVHYFLAAAGMALATLAPTAGMASDARGGDGLAGDRPSGVPASYLQTPYGYVAPQTVVRLRKGESVAARQAGRRASRDVNPGECQSARFSAAGAKLDSARAPRGKLAAKNQYLADAAVNFPRDYQTIQMTTDVVVPPAPTQKGKQILYLLSGLHDTADLSGPMVQTVLSWNMMGITPGWTVTTWFASEDDDCLYVSDPVSTSPGEKLRQIIEARQDNGQHVIRASVIDGEAGNPLVQTTFTPPAFNPDQVVNIGLEGYNVKTCNLMPAGGEVLYPYVSTDLTTSAGTKNISDQIVVAPSSSHKCAIALTLDAQ